LDARENRARTQRAWINRHALPLISFTINMVGEVKSNLISNTAYQQGYDAIIHLCQAHDIQLVAEQQWLLDTGNEFLAVVDNIPALQLKSVMLTIEEHHPLGRLFDIDVFDNNGHIISRDSVDQPRRRCLVCDQDAKICVRSRAHPLNEVIEKMSEMVRACL
jgi:holo-ACP synthase